MSILIRIICLFIPFPSIRRPFRRWLKVKLEPYDNLYNLFFLRRYLSGHNVVVWFDHSLGGGTETYSLRQFKEMRHKKQRVLRIQYIPEYKYFLLSTPIRFRKTRYITTDLNLLFQIKTSEIVINNLVSYKKPLEILDLVARLKQAAQSTPHVSFRGHDFHSICPSYNLVNCDGVFCNLKCRGGCDKCLCKKYMNATAVQKKLLNCEKISDWRMGWGNFFATTVDECIVFSDAIKNIFVKTYPQLSNKTVVIPHKTQKLRRVSVAPHNEINIACLGSISHAKGCDIVLEMCDAVKSIKNVNIFIIGTLDTKIAKPDNLTITGKYSVHNLPAIIEKHKIDLIFISSIWPETFSYTASEAMSMNIPVACYDMGAPAERVGKYEHGLVLSEINPKQNLKEIIAFIKQKRKEA